jgi:shikimate kinase
MRKNIILTGFMGTGKTAVGKRLAQLLDYEFVDTDRLIEERDGRSIPQIFAQSGEAAFRALEREVACELAVGRTAVISTGGGMMMDNDNAAVFLESGLVFCLTAEVDTILKRLSLVGAGKRPLLAGPDPRGRIETLLAERKAKYGRFRQVTTDSKSIDGVALDLLGMIMEGEDG